MNRKGRDSFGTLLDTRAERLKQACRVFGDPLATGAAGTYRSDSAKPTRPLPKAPTLLPPDSEPRPPGGPGVRGTGSRPPGGPGGPTLVVGVLGGIASGKSLAAQELAGSEGLVLDADAIAHGVLASPEITARVREAFGAEVLGADGTPDRARLAAQVFADPELRQRLEGWIHPAVRANIAAELADARASRVPLVVLDVPLLLENEAQHDLVAQCDVLVFIDTPAEDRKSRASATRGWDEREVARREANQLPLTRKRSRATHVLENSDTAQAFRQRARALRAELLREPPMERAQPER